MGSINPDLNTGRPAAYDWLNSILGSDYQAWNGAFGNSDRKAARTGSGLTTQQIQQMQFSQYQQDQLNMREDTAAQRQIADLQAAGINPALAIGGTIPEGASSSSVTGDFASTANVDSDPLSWLGSIQNLMMSGVQIAQGKATIDKLKADAELARANANKTGEETKWIGPLAQANIDNTTQQIVQSKQTVEESKERINEIRATVGKVIAETDSESERASLLHWEGAVKMYEATTARIRANHAEEYETALINVQHAYGAALKAQTHNSYKQALLAEAQAGKIEYESTELLPASKNEIEAQVAFIKSKTGLTDQEARYYSTHLYFECLESFTRSGNNAASSFPGGMKNPTTMATFNFQNFVHDKFESVPPLN